MQRLCYSYFSHMENYVIVYLCLEVKIIVTGNTHTIYLSFDHDDSFLDGFQSSTIIMWFCIFPFFY